MQQGIRPQGTREADQFHEFFWFFLKVIDDDTISREFPDIEGMDVKYHRCHI